MIIDLEAFHQMIGTLSQELAVADTAGLDFMAVAEVAAAQSYLALAQTAMSKADRYQTRALAEITLSAYRK
ncbi:MAG: hypothetical protein KGL39_35830 [Patescibacteria group bacterium]|nr:hypothetical protein [Patescibacteria group bacterium]